MAEMLICICLSGQHKIEKELKMDLEGKPSSQVKVWKNYGVPSHGVYNFKSKDTALYSLHLGSWKTTCVVIAVATQKDTGLSLGRTGTQ